MDNLWRYGLRRCQGHRTSRKSKRTNLARNVVKNEGVVATAERVVSRTKGEQTYLTRDEQKDGKTR
ncbi:MAG: hypothetical protein PUP93_11395 [Rhizonema sp. NSF051]|nr:hypothetical protein [Rhizonema sp. NSF051]